MGSRPGEDSSSTLFELLDAVVMRAGKPILSVGSFSLSEGEHLAVLGPNGSGKSTFVKLMTREMLPLHRDNPPVLFRGRSRIVLSEVKKTLGIVSSTMQDQIAVHLPAQEVVAGGLSGTLGMPPGVEMSEETLSRAGVALESVGIADLATRDIMTLSTGQARRVLIARALVHDPTVLVFDEPCTGLDPEGMYYVRRSMRLLAQAGKTVVLVTHYPEDIIPEIDRLVLIRQGMVLAEGGKRDLLVDDRMSQLYGVPLHVERRAVPQPRELSQGDTPASVAGQEASTSSDEYFSLVSAY